MKVQQRNTDINERHTLEIAIETTMTTNAWYPRSYHFSIACCLVPLLFRLSLLFAHRECNSIAWLSWAYTIFFQIIIFVCFGIFPVAQLYCVREARALDYVCVVAREYFAFDTWKKISLHLPNTNPCAHSSSHSMLALLLYVSHCKHGKHLIGKLHCVLMLLLIISGRSATHLDSCGVYYDDCCCCFYHCSCWIEMALSMQYSPIHIHNKYVKNCTIEWFASSKVNSRTFNKTAMALNMMNERVNKSVRMPSINRQHTYIIDNRRGKMLQELTVGMRATESCRS